MQCYMINSRSEPLAPRLVRGVVENCFGCKVHHDDQLQMFMFDCIISLRGMFQRAECFRLFEFIQYLQSWTVYNRNTHARATFFDHLFRFYCSYLLGIGIDESYALPFLQLGIHGSPGNIQCLRFFDEKLARYGRSGEEVRYRLFRYRKGCSGKIPLIISFSICMRCVVRYWDGLNIETDLVGFDTAFELLLLRLLLRRKARRRLVIVERAVVLAFVGMDLEPIPSHEVSQRMKE
mmetsp:Transcript_16162/g.38759  ORF Transcript_16162/g.38759 Transcript_16162/m.38759 type:complete len:235 (-) Transcript_16162:179-883(-)